MWGQSRSLGVLLYWNPINNEGLRSLGFKGITGSYKRSRTGSLCSCPWGYTPGHCLCAPGAGEHVRSKSVSVRVRGAVSLILVFIGCTFANVYVHN